jgi:Flp pilus assembly protein TadG
MLLRNKKSIIKDERGSVTILAGLLMIAMMVIAGMAIDYSRASSLNARVQTALDAAALAATKALVETSASDAEISALAQKYYDEAMDGRSGTAGSLGALAITINRDEGFVALNVSGKVNTTIGQVANIDAFDVNLSSRADFSIKDIELGVMLDVSGSMSGEKLASLKAAGNDLIDLLMGDKPASQKVRIGLAPYSTSINAGAYAAKAKGNSGNNSGPGNNNGNGNAGEKCVSERKGNDAFTDEPPANGRTFGGKPTACPVNTVLALTDDKDALSASLNGYVADGRTAGHLGIAWAWYLVSPKWDTFWPAASKPEQPNDAKLVKAIIVMTDGMFNQEYEIDNGTSAQQAQELCENIKNEGVLVFTVGFQAPAEVMPLMQACASKPEYAFDAANGAALRTSFSQISRQLNALRISE